MSYKSIEELLENSKSNFNVLLDYIESDTILDFETNILNNFKEFEDYFNKNYKEPKKEFYENYNIYNSSKYKKSIADWMLNRILELDLEDSIDKFFYSNIIIYCKKKDLYFKIKKTL